MPETERINYTHKELTELMVRAAGLNEGTWMLLAEFNFAAANIGQGDQANPGAMVMVKSIGLQRIKEGQNTPPHLTVNASDLEPSA